MICDISFCAYRERIMILKRTTNAAKRSLLTGAVPQRLAFERWVEYAYADSKGACHMVCVASLVCEPVSVSKQLWQLPLQSLLIILTAGQSNRHMAAGCKQNMLCVTAQVV